MNAEPISIPIQTSDGIFLAHYSGRGLASLEFPRSNQLLRRLTATTKLRLQPPVRDWHRLAVQAVRGALEGKKVADLPPLDLSAGTLFQKEVWGALRRTGAGKTTTYAQVAKTINKPKAARAVGSACGANPIPILIPCHRVLGANNQFGGFSAGLKWKRLLLEREGFKASTD